MHESNAFCRRLAKRTARNFYYSFLTLPGEQYRAMCALYGFSRVCDDLGDDASSTFVEKAEHLREWRAKLERAMAGDPSGHALFPALSDVVARYAIPPEHLHAVIDGMESDLNFTGYETFAELQRYCYRVAGAVGLCCVRIWGCDEECSVQPAVDCGTAFQLTNILRDLGEDAAMGRVYLPREDLRRFGYTADDVAAHRRDGGFRDLMSFQVERARTFYRNAEELFGCLKPPGRS
ncbi:MAG: phytoene/squalene synthase family protein, partial [Planctomycetaceae bacterium]